MDSGASSHMTPEKKLLTDYREFDKPEKVGLGDGRSVEAVGVGTVHLNMVFKVSDPKRAVVHKVLYVPKLACNLFSVRGAVAMGNTVKGTDCLMRTHARLSSDGMSFSMKQFSTGNLERNSRRIQWM